VSDFRPEPKPEPIDWSARVREAERNGELPEEDPYDLTQLRGYEPVHPESPLRSFLRKLWVPIAFVGALFWKFKAVAVAVLKFKFLATALSGLVSIAAYALLWGWWFAVGLVVLLFIHEMGHVVEAKRQGLPVSAPVFIPFMGALISLKQMPHNAWNEAKLAIAGPIIGSAGALALFLTGVALDSRALKALAFLGFFINLFNLLPVVPLDGGRIVAALHPAFWLVGFLALLGLCIWRPNPILIIILLFSASELWRRWQMRGHPEMQEYYRVEPHQRLIIGVLYFGLAVLLVLGMHETHVPRDF